MLLPDQCAETPAGNPFAPDKLSSPIPVAPVVVWVIAVSAVLIHKVGVVEAADTVLSGVTIIVPVAFTDPHPPVNGIV